MDKKKCVVTIKVLNTRTKEMEKPNKYNTFWDELGQLKGIQSYLQVVYTIQIEEEDDE